MKDNLKCFSLIKHSEYTFNTIISLIIQLSYFLQYYYHKELFKNKQSN